MAFSLVALSVLLMDAMVEPTVCEKDELKVVSMDELKVVL